MGQSGRETKKDRMKDEKRILPQNLIDKHPGLGKWNIIHAYRGSYAHGTRLEPDERFFIDDIDTMAVCVPPKDYYLGLKDFHSRGTQEIKEGVWDIVVYEVKKAVSLLAGGNPNILSLLWMGEDKYINITGAGRLLLDNRDLFTSKKIHKAFVGYGYGQLHRMTNQAFEGYMGDKRRQLFQSLGFDAKNASHAIRIFRMGIEMMETGKLVVERPDAEELKAIKRGEWSLEQIREESDRLKKRADEVYESSKLPYDVDYEKINKLTMEIVETAWGEQHE